MNSTELGDILVYAGVVGCIITACVMIYENTREYLTYPKNNNETI